MFLKIFQKGQKQKVVLQRKLVRKKWYVLSLSFNLDARAIKKSKKKHNYASTYFDIFQSEKEFSKIGLNVAIRLDLPWPSTFISSITVVLKKCQVMARFLRADPLSSD